MLNLGGVLVCFDVFVCACCYSVGFVLFGVGLLLLIFVFIYVVVVCFWSGFCICDVLEVGHS